jgi:putative hydrolase
MRLVSTPSPFGGGNFFENLLGDLLKMLATQGPVHWELARQVAQGVASGGQPEANVDPLERIRLEELVRVADLHVADATGLTTTVSGRVVTIQPVTRAEWAWHTLEAWRPLLDSLARSLSGAPDTGPEGTAGPGGRPEGTVGPGGRPEDTAGSGETGEQREPFEPGVPAEPAGLGEQRPVPGFDLGPDQDPSGFLGQLGQVMGPTLLGLQFGAMVGHLAERAMGQYDLPIPRAQSDQLMMVPANIAAFADDWSLPLDDVRLWVSLSEVTHHAILGRPHVRVRMLELLEGYASGFQHDPSALEDRLSDIDPTNPSSLQQALGDPTALLGELQTPAQRQQLSQLEALTAAIEGYVDHVMDSVGHRLITSYGALTEALRRRRVERGEADRFVERLFGLELGQAQFDRGAAFVKGVLERGDEQALAQLWTSARHLPTPAEVDAPGLWLERISIPTDDT